MVGRPAVHSRRAQRKRVDCNARKEFYISACCIQAGPPRDSTPLLPTQKGGCHPPLLLETQGEQLQQDKHLACLRAPDPPASGEKRNPVSTLSPRLFPGRASVWSGCRRELPRRLPTRLPRKKTQIAPRTPKLGVYSHAAPSTLRLRQSHPGCCQLLKRCGERGEAGGGRRPPPPPASRKVVPKVTSPPPTYFQQFKHFPVPQIKSYTELYPLKKTNHS